MSTLPTITVGANDLTDWLQDRSMNVKRNSVDATFIDEPGDMPAIPALGDTLVVTDPDWTGTIVSVISTGWKGNIPFYKVRATNDDVLPDAGPAPWGLSDAPDHSTTYGFKDLEVTRILDGDPPVEEVRSKCIVFQEGLSVGMEIAITSVVEGYSAETFTIMELSYDWPISDGATYTLDLGKGVFADATTGGSDGGPLDPVTLEDEIGNIAKDNCCDEDGGAGDPFTGGEGIPLATISAGGVCDTSPVSHGLTVADNLQGTLTDSLGGPGTGQEVGSWVYYNIAYTSGAYPCGISGGSWKGWEDVEAWIEFTAPADDPTSYLGMRFSIDCTSLDTNGLPQGYEIRLAQGAAATGRYGQGASIMNGPTSGTTDVLIPRNLIDWGGTNCIVLHALWSCDRPVQFCAPGGSFSNPRAEGWGHSGSYDDFGYGTFCPVGLTTGAEGMAIGVPGIGDTDGVNNEYELLSWTGLGSVAATINGLEQSATSMTLDTGAHTVAFTTPPPVDAVVLFTYQAST